MNQTLRNAFLTINSLKQRRNNCETFNDYWQIDNQVNLNPAILVPFVVLYNPKTLIHTIYTCLLCRDIQQKHISNKTWILLQNN